MPMVEICGILVNFPFEPYPCQIDYMQKVITCLKTGVNGILESPTGTGKTLCLLCASLAWLEDKKAQIAGHRRNMASGTGVEGGQEGAVGSAGGGAVDYFKEAYAKQLDEAAGSWMGELVAPKIIYASRTHSQLTQAMQELKRTAYKHFKVSVLGSREQLCIHPQVVREESNTTKVHMCRAKIASRTCVFYNNVEANKAAFSGQVMDIEDVVKLGVKTHCCPYYASRELKSDADIIFLPYNYLLDAKSRKAQDVQLNGNIVIFDEAHNLEQICEDSASFDWTSTDMALALKEVGDVSTKILDAVQEEESGDVLTQDLTSSAGTKLDMNLNEVLHLKTQLMQLEEALYSIDLPADGQGLSKPGRFIFEFLEKANVTFESRSHTMELIDRIVSYLTNNATSVFHSKGHGLTKFGDVLKTVFSREVSPQQASLSVHQANIARHYRVHVRQEAAADRTNRRKGGWGDAAAATPASAKPQRTIGYWCFSAGYTMEELTAGGVRSVLLTSGTLSPMQSFKTEMGIEFPIELENPHVISKDQVWIGVTGKGPDGVALTSAYSTRFNEDYMASLGNTIVNYARVIPGGMLVFFPSYPVLGKCTDTWKNGGIWTRIEQHKPVFVEPRSKGEFTACMEGYYGAVSDPAKLGAALVAVCRGKVSEGLDFSDANGRAVIITGQPFPPRMDPKIVLKMAYLDENRSQGRKGLSGQEWYRQQASRAVNQAIGRVIRHKDDYGAIVLCDNRFATRDSIAQLPMWVRSSVKTFDNFGLGLRDLMTFFKQAERSLPTPRPARPLKEPACQGAFFMPSTGTPVAQANIMKNLPKASSVDQHVPGLASAMVLDEARLRQQYLSGAGTADKSRLNKSGGRYGLLEALDSSEQRNKPLQASNSAGLQFAAAAVQQGDDIQPRKKIKLKSASESSRVKDAMMPAAEYVAEVKAKLSHESYAAFSAALEAYKTSKNFDAMVAVMADLFVGDTATHHLFQKFFRFVLPVHREKFRQTCRDLIGLECVSSADKNDNKCSPPLQVSAPISSATKPTTLAGFLSSKVREQSAVTNSALGSASSGLQLSSVGDKHSSSSSGCRSEPFVAKRPCTNDIAKQTKPDYRKKLEKSSVMFDQSKINSFYMSSTDPNFIDQSDRSSPLYDQCQQSSVEPSTKRAIIRSKTLPDQSGKNAVNCSDQSEVLYLQPLAQSSKSHLRPNQSITTEYCSDQSKKTEHCSGQSTRTENTCGQSAKNDCRLDKSETSQCCVSQSLTSQSSSNLSAGRSAFKLISKNSYCFQKDSIGKQCGHCRSGAVSEVTALNCGHTCCIACWESVMKPTSKCPQCSEKTRRKYLVR